MKKQNGQTAVEFAMILPLFFMMCFGMIYGAMMFLDYLQFNNAAGAIARDISLMNSEDERFKFIADLNNQDKATIKRYSNQLTSLYEPKFSAEENEAENLITVEIKFTRTDDLAGLLKKLNFPPENLGKIKIKMSLKEKT